MEAFPTAPLLGEDCGFSTDFGGVGARRARSQMDKGKAADKPERHQTQFVERLEKGATLTYAGKRL
jgi:hypothetical protein